MIYLERSSADKSMKNMNILSIHARPGGKRTIRTSLDRGGSGVSDMANQPGSHPSPEGEIVVMLGSLRGGALLLRLSRPLLLWRID